MEVSVMIEKRGKRVLNSDKHTQQKDQRCQRGYVTWVSNNRPWDSPCGFVLVPQQSLPRKWYSSWPRKAIQRGSGPYWVAAKTRLAQTKRLSWRTQTRMCCAVQSDPLRYESGNIVTRQHVIILRYDDTPHRTHSTRRWLNVTLNVVMWFQSLSSNLNKQEKYKWIYDVTWGMGMFQ